MEWSEVVPHLTGLAHLATVRPDGDPHVSVVSPVIDGDLVWVASTHSSRKVRNLAVRPRAAMMWSPLAEVYVHADVELVDDVDAKRRLWDGGVFQYDPAMFFGTVDNPDFLLLRMTPTSAVVMRQSESGLVRERWTAFRT